MLLSQREVIGRRIRVDVKLDGAQAVGLIAQDGRGHQRPIQPATQNISGDLPLAQGAGGKIPERTLAPARFVDCQSLDIGLRAGFAPPHSLPEWVGADLTVALKPPIPEVTD